MGSSNANRYRRMSLTPSRSCGSEQKKAAERIAGASPYIPSMGHDFKPVYIWASAGTKHRIGDVLRAADWLMQHWPDEFAASDLH